MNLPSEVFGDVIVVHTPEEFGSDQADHFQDALTRLDRKWMVLDLDRTELLDSAGLTALLDAYDLLRDRGGQVKVATTNAVNRKILEITRLDQQLEVFDGVIDAVRSFR